MATPDGGEPIRLLPADAFAVGLTFKDTRTIEDPVRTHLVIKFE
jgi:uncharacterized cupin superfamily protein